MEEEKYDQDGDFHDWRKTAETLTMTCTLCVMPFLDNVFIKEIIIKSSTVRFICNQKRKLHNDRCEEEEDNSKDCSKGLLGGAVAEIGVTDAELDVGSTLHVCAFS